MNIRYLDLLSEETDVSLKKKKKQKNKKNKNNSNNNNNTTGFRGRVLSPALPRGYNYSSHDFLVTWNPVKEGSAEWKIR